VFENVTPLMGWLGKLIRTLFGVVFTGLFLASIALLALYLYLEPRLPSIEELREVRLQVPLRVYTRDEKLIAEFGEKRREPLTFSEFPEQLVQAILAAEDNRFFEHPGVDYQGLVRAAVQLAITGERRQGGSTITMQVARNFFLTREKTFSRKLNEILLALKIEQELTKQEILTLYLNKIYLGNRAYGVGAAAQVYYGEPLDELTLAQLAMIAGLPKAPSRFNPIADPERAKLRRDYVLGRMHRLGFIAQDSYQEGLAAPLTAELHAAATHVEAPYAAEMVRAEMVNRYADEAYTEGYRVYTTIDSGLQEAANRALRENLDAYDQRHGFRNNLLRRELAADSTEQDWDALLRDQPRVGDLRPALVVEIEEKSTAAYLGNGERAQIPWEGLVWARAYRDENHTQGKPKVAADILARGDLIYVKPASTSGAKGDEKEFLRLAQVPQVEGALISLDPTDGSILALVGGYDFYQSKFNRAIQARRQPGSAFKAFIYSAALEAGLTPASIINDAPVVLHDAGLEADWRPENYSGKFFGPTRLRYALAKSRNLVSIRVLRQMGVPHALNHISRFGFDAGGLPKNLSLALGSGEVSLLEMARGYSVFANGGFLIAPYFIERVENEQRDILFQASPLRICDGCPEASEQDEELLAPRAISPQNWYLMNSMLRDVVAYGTATKARSLGRNDLAGKTGTTNDQKDAWFCGFNTDIVTVAWVGFDSSAPLGRGETGGKAALPAWISYMGAALSGKPEKPLKMPPDIVTVRIDPKTGLLASADQRDAIFEVFRTQNVPQKAASAVLTRLPDKAGETVLREQVEDPF